MSMLSWKFGTSALAAITLLAEASRAQEAAQSTTGPEQAAPQPTLNANKDDESAASADAPAVSTQDPSPPKTPEPQPESAPAVAAPPGGNTSAASTPANGKPVAVETPNAETSWFDHLTLGGGVVLYLYQPTRGGQNNFSVFYANLLLDGKWGDFGVHVEPRFRDSKLRPFFDGPVWLQEAYVSWSPKVLTIKVGKLYKQSGGMFWDNSFFGNVQVYDGLKLDPNYGVSIEGSAGAQFGVDFAAQYFVTDGRTNVSLDGRDTLSVPGARRRNTFAGRVAPYLKLGSAGAVRAGFSGEHFTATLPIGDRRVSRLAADARFSYAFGAAGALDVRGEYLHQGGQHVVDHPSVDGASAKNDYWLVGGEYSLWRLTLRYNVSHANYRDVNTTELMHVPAIGFKVHDNIALLGEYVIWRRFTPAGSAAVDTSLNVTATGHF
jgi:hypothetical protein